MVFNWSPDNKKPAFSTLRIYAVFLQKKSVFGNTSVSFLVENYVSIFPICAHDVITLYTPRYNLMWLIEPSIVSF